MSCVASCRRPTPLGGGLVPVLAAVLAAVLAGILASGCTLLMPPEENPVNIKLSALDFLTDQPSFPHSTNDNPASALKQ